MKKSTKKQSITRIIRPREGVLRYGRTGANTEIKNVERVVGKVPTRKYRVTYTVEKKGRYIVRTLYGMSLVARKGHGRFYVCFIPEKWKGKRVSRKVEVMK